MRLNNGLSVASIELIPLFGACLQQGWRVEKCTNGHYKCIPSDKAKAIVYTSGTPGRGRAILNIRGKLKRNGLVI